MPGKYFAKTSTTKAAYSLLDALDRPIVFVGGVTVSDTKDRLNPPDPICGLNLGYTPLGNGHIMALQLGGPDDSYNIVPQYQQWQQSGRWRVLEKDAMQHASAGDWIFVAHLHYGNTGKLSANKIDEKFYNGDVTIYWDDERIPTVFDIWLLQASSKEGVAIAANVLDPKAKTPGTEAGSIPALLASVKTFRSNDDQNGVMPHEDQLYWRSQELGNTVTALFNQYKLDRPQQLAAARQEMTAGKMGTASEVDEMEAVLMSPKRETEYEFIEGYGDRLRAVVKADRGWTPSEITQYGSNTHMLQAVFHQSTLKAATKKSNTKRLGEYSKVMDSGVNKRKKIAEDKPDYAKMLARYERGLM